MSALIHALYETDMVGVARYVWRKNATPKLLALVPSIKADREVMELLGCCGILPPPPPFLHNSLHSPFCIVSYSLFSLCL